MKIREGFVSNSSTSSFICGPDVTVKQAIEVMNKIVEVANTFDIKFSSDEYNVFQADKGFGHGWDEYYGKQIKQAIEEKRTVVEDMMSNDIPYTFHDLIERALKATRLHFG